jgi:hypothetical protein
MLKLGTLVLFLAAAATTFAGTVYHISLFEPSVIHGSTLKAGDYKVEVEGDKAVIHDGKNVVEAPVKVESTAAKISETQIIGNGNPESGAPLQVEAIRIGGTHTILHFEK